MFSSRVSGDMRFAGAPRLLNSQQAHALMLTVSIAIRALEQRSVAA